MIIDINQQRVIIDRIAEHIRKQYIFPERSIDISNQLMQAYSQLVDIEADQFANNVTALLRKLSNDQHLELKLQDNDGKQDPEALFQEIVRQSINRNFGFGKLEVMDDNIGFINLTELPPVHIAGEKWQASMIFLAHTSAIIIDLSNCNGGTPDMVRRIITTFMDSQKYAISGIQHRDSDKSVSAFTEIDYEGIRLPEKPLFIITSEETFSGAEALAYDLQALKRAQVIGERTRGGAHLSDFVAIDEHFVLVLPIARALNPITDSNWEGVGVQPDIEIDVKNAISKARNIALDQ